MANPPNDPAVVPGLSHVDAEGRPQLVDISPKTASFRQASAEGWVTFAPDVYARLREAEGQTKKGPVLTVAQLAGIMAAKRTSDLIPLCHPLPLEKIALRLDWQEESCAVRIEATVAVHHLTGVEMEALTAVSVAALTVYDMTKALSHDIRIGPIQLVAKQGGKQDFQRQDFQHTEP